MQSLLRDLRYAARQLRKSPARLINSLLFETTTADPFSLFISVAALISVTLCAVTIPALRAASVNPVEALRSE